MAAEGAGSVGNPAPASRATANGAQAEVEALRHQQAESAATVRQLQDLVATLTAASRPISAPVSQMASVVTPDFTPLRLGDGVEFREWAAYMEMILEEMGLAAHLENDPEADTTSPAWLSRDRKAKLLVLKGLDPADSAAAMRHKTVAGIWAFLTGRAKLSGSLNVYRQLKAFHSCHQTSGEQVREFAARLQSLQEEVEQSLSPFEYPEPIRVWMLLEGLRPDYDSVKLSIHTNQLKSFDPILQALVLHEDSTAHLGDGDRIRRVQAPSPPNPPRSPSSPPPSSSDGQTLTEGCAICGGDHHFSKCLCYRRSLELLKRANRLLPRARPGVTQAGATLPSPQRQ